MPDPTKTDPLLFELDNEFPPGSGGDPSNGVGGGDPQQLPADLPLDPAIVGMILDLPFGMLARARGDHWKLTDADKAMVCPPLAAVLDKYLPGAMGKFGPEIALLICTAAIIMPRMQTDAEIAKQEELNAARRFGTVTDTGTKGAETPA